MKQALLDQWISLLQERRVSFREVVSRLDERYCPVCSQPTLALLMASNHYWCPKDQNHGFLEFRTRPQDFYCHRCRTSVWDYGEGMRHCADCNLPFPEIALMEAAEKNLPSFPEPIPALNGNDVHIGLLRRVLAKLGL